MIVVMYDPGLLILHFAYFKRATHAEKDGRWDDRSNLYMVEKAHEEALHNKVMMMIVVMYDPRLLILHFAYFKRATHAKKDGRWDDRSNPYMVEKAHEEALHDKVA